VYAHPRLSVNSLSSVGQTLPDDIAMWRDLGIDHVGLISPKIEAVGWGAARTLVSDAALRVSNISIERHVVMESLELAAVLGASVVYLCTGPAAGRTWEEAAEVFCEEIAPAAWLARELGVTLAVEPTNPLRGDVSFVHSLRDALHLARAAEIAVVLDFYSCWYERELEQLVRDNLEALALVQICDYELGTFDTPNRSVIGEGDIPVERLLRMLINAGYCGAFDLEILGPKIENEGYAHAIRRSVARASEILDRLELAD
jgi:sugar phosphate isomerase/epimerase